MRLLRLEIENFGKLSGYSMALSEGLNTVCEENGFGKSTVAAFIKAMLYGLPASTKRNLDKNERKKYTPWQGGNYGGSLEFESDKGRFRIQRFFATKEANDEFRLFDLSTNKPSDAYSADVGIELFGIDAEGFARSAFLSQSGMDDNDENVSVTAKLTGLLEDVNDMGSYDVAMEIIDKRRKFYEVKGGRGRVSDLSSALAERGRELDRINELLAQQTNLENSLEQKRERISSAEQDLQSLREQLRLSELRGEHLAECKRLQTRIDENETQRQQILSAFRDRNLPTEEELTNAQRLLKEYRIEQNNLRAIQLSNEENDALQRLRQRYTKGRPSAELLSKLHATVRAESETAAALRAARVIENTQEQLLFAKTGIPSSEQLDAISEKLEQANELERKLTEGSSENSSEKKTRLLSVAALTVLASGLLCGVAAFLFPALQVMLLIFGGITLTIGGILYLVSKNNRIDAARQEALLRLREEQQKRLSEIHDFLKRYGFFREEQSVQHNLNQLISTARRAAEDQQRQAAQKHHAEALRRNAEETRAKLQTLFEACGYSRLPEDPQNALLHIHADLREWDMLAQKAHAVREKEQAIEAVLQQKQNAISAFINRLSERDSNQPEACLEKMEELCRKHAILLGNIRQQQQDLKERIERHRVTVPTELPDENLLQTREQALTQQLDLLRKEEARIHRQWNQSTEQTQKIPQLEDELSHLAEELRSAENNLNILRRTAQLLTESKEALSTRYLGGMQEHFNHFRTMVEGEDIPEADIDTSFSISVRDAGKSRELESYSRGSRDILQFCARLSLTKSMFENEEKPFLLLDDPFVNLDEARFASVRRLLDQLSKEFQILYLVCHSDRC